MQLVQGLKPNDQLLRRNLKVWALNQLDIDSLFHEKIISSDATHSWLNGFVNKQNYNTENRYAIHETKISSSAVLTVLLMK